MTKRTVIIDGDLIAYRYAAAAEKRSIIATLKANGNSKEFKNRSELKEFVTKAGFDYDPEHYEIEDVQKAVAKSIALDMVENFIKRIIEFTWADNHEIYLGEGDTFRHALPLPNPYKSNRDTLKPVHLKAARDFLCKKYGAKVITNGLETDDVITIRAYDYLNIGEEVVLCSVDKDSYQTQGCIVFNWLGEPEEWKLEEIPDVGELRKEKSSIKGSGLKFLAYQVLAGDDADTYCGYDLSEVKYGPTKAMNALKDAETEQEIMQILFSEFKMLYPKKFKYKDCHGKTQEGDWLQQLQLYWQCAYMKRSLNDPSDIFDFMNERGIDYAKFTS